MHAQTFYWWVKYVIFSFGQSMTAASTFVVYKTKVWKIGQPNIARFMNCTKLIVWRFLHCIDVVWQSPCHKGTFDAVIPNLAPFFEKLSLFQSGSFDLAHLVWKRAWPVLIALTKSDSTSTWHFSRANDLYNKDVIRIPRSSIFSTRMANILIFNGAFQYYSNKQW